jgi:hypothetical protein
VIVGGEIMFLTYPGRCTGTALSDSDFPQKSAASSS